MSQLAGYIGPISTAMWVFPFVALLFTVPYVLSSYHRYGAVLFSAPWWCIRSSFI